MIIDSPRVILPEVGLSSTLKNQLLLSAWPSDDTYKVDLDGLNGTAPAIETEDLVGKIDDLFCGEIMYLSTSCSGSRRDILGAKLLFQS